MNKKIMIILTIILFFINVILDVITTMLLIINPYLYESNPYIAFIFNTYPLIEASIYFLFLKIISFIIILYILNFQYKKYHNLCYITFMIILIMSSYIVLNNILLLM